MLSSICLLIHDNLYDSKRHFTHGLAEALNRQGITTTLIDIHDGGLQNSHVTAILNAKPNLTASFNSMDPLEGTQYLWDILKIPHLSLLVDPAMYSLKLAKSAYSLLSCVDQLDVSLVRSTGFDRVFFLPHGVQRELCEGKNNDKPYDIVFIGSCYDPQQWKGQVAKDLWPSIEQAIRLVLIDPLITVQEALLRLWKETQLDPSQHNFLELFRAIDMGSRALERIELIKNIKGPQVHIFGEGEWCKHLLGQPNVEIHAPVSYVDSLSIMKQAKVCLNSMPFFKHGSHERVFAALACEAAVLTSPSVYLEEQFGDGNGVVKYQYGEWDALNTNLADMLGNASRTQAEIERGRQLVKQHHTWDQRAMTLKDQQSR